MRIVRTFLLGLALASAVLVQADEHATANFFSQYDLAATSVTYFRLVGQGGSPWGQDIEGQTTIKTTGSSTTVTAVTASTNPFANTGVGSTISVRFADGTSANRTIVAKASADSVTVGAAVDLSAGYHFTYRILQSGTGADDGWIDVAGASEVEVTWQLDTLNATNVQFVLEGMDEALGAQPTNVHPGDGGNNTNCPGGTFSSGYCTYTAAGRATRTKIHLGGKFSKLRVGALLNTDGGAQSVTAYVKVIQWRGR